MKLYLATWLTDPTHGKSLTNAGQTYRLVSYYYLIAYKDRYDLHQYVETGRSDE